jgi:hypothetical protein
MRIFITFTGILAMLIFVLPLKAQRIYPQNDTAKQYIIIERKDTSNIIYWKLKYNRITVVKVKDVNRFVYKSTTGEQTGKNLFTEVPTAFTGLKLPAFSSRRIPSIGGTATISQTKSAEDMAASFKTEGTKKLFNPCNCQDADSIIKHSPVLNFLHESLIEYFDTIKVYGAAFNTIVQNSDTLIALKENVHDTWDSIQARKLRLFARFQDSIRKTGINPYGLTLISGYKSVAQQAALFDTALSPLFKQFAELLGSVVENCYDSTVWVRALRCLDPCKSKKDSIMYYGYLDSLEKMRKCIGKITAKIESISDDVKKTKLLVEEMKAAVKDGKLQILLKNYDLISEENFSYTLDEFIADKDVHDITVKILAEEPLRYNQPQNRTIKVKAITTGGIKVDFSTGAFVNFGNNEFLGPDYYYKTIDTVNKQIIEAERTKKAMFSIGALVHFYIRANWFVKPALSLGVSTTASFDAVNLHGGLSALIGKPGTTSRFVVTAGITLREVSLLDNRYQLNTNYQGLPDVVPESKNFPKAGGFFAITYNLFK